MINDSFKGNRKCQYNLKNSTSKLSPNYFNVLETGMYLSDLNINIL